MAKVSPEAAKALTDERAWRRITGPARIEALEQIDDAVRQVMAAPNKHTRNQMLTRLPQHISDIVRARIMAYWGGKIAVFASDNSAEGQAEAKADASRRGLGDDAVHVLYLEGVTVVTMSPDDFWRKG